MRKNKLIPLSLVGLLFIGITQIACTTNSNRTPTAASHRIHQSYADTANAPLLSWLEKKSDSLNDWMSKRGTPGGPPDFIDFYIPKTSPRLSGPLGDEKRIARETKALYDQYFPPSDPSSVVGTFFESGNPYIQTSRGPYQWDSLKASGMKDPVLFEKAVKALKLAGIKSMRIGPNLFELNPAKPESWEPFVNMIEVMWRNGVTPTISVAFFPGLKRWEVKKANGEIDYEKSYLLHPEFPRDMGRLTSGMMKTLWQRAAVVEKELGHKVNFIINPINEPETLAGFNRHFWHGAHANWGHPETLKFYIPSVIQIAKANVEVRLAVEAMSNGRRILFAHNEAMTPDYYPSHQGAGRFAVSKFMLGDDVIMKAPLDEYKEASLSTLKENVSAPKNEVRWAVKEYVFGSWNKSENSQIKARDEIITALAELRELHSSLIQKTKKSMRTDNILLVDYYYQTEFVLPKNIDKLAAEFAENQGEKLQKTLGVSDDVFFGMLQNAAEVVKNDLPPQGPKGSLVDFKYKKLSDVNFKELFEKHDYVVLERLIGLRREYNFKDGMPYESRQKRAGIRDMGQLYRLDHLIQNAAKNNGAGLKEILGVKSDEDMWKEINSISSANKSKILIDVLSDDANKVFRELLGIKREMLLGFEPQHYARQIRGGIRHGFHKFMLEYVNELRLFTAGVGESGTPFYIFAPLLHDQVLIEYASVLKSGVYGTQYAFGPAVDTRGWAKSPLGLHYDDDHEINPSGLLKVIPGTGGNEGTVKFRTGNDDADKAKPRDDERENYWYDKSWPQQFINPLLEGLR